VDVNAEVRISDGTRTIISSKLFTGMSRARSRSSAAPLSLKVVSVSQALAVAEFQSFRRAAHAMAAAEAWRKHVKASHSEFLRMIA
jgi:hypothetical protein